MSRTSIAALLFAFSAFALGIAGPALDPAVLKEQLAFAERTTEKPAPPPAEEAGERSLKDEAARWLKRKIRERNDRAEAEAAAAQPAPAPGLFGPYAAYVLPAATVLALAAIVLAAVDWLRTHAVRPNLTAGLVAAAAIVLPFAWSAISIGLSVAAILIAVFLVGSVFG